MTRKGFALLATLWLLVVVTGLAAIGYEAARLELDIARNRLALLQGEWASEACVEIVKARYQREFQDGLRYENDRLARRLLSTLTLDSVPLRERIWCRAAAVDAGSRVDVTVASREALLCAVRDSTMVNAVMRIRQAASGEALVRFLGSQPKGSIRLNDMLTQHGTGQVNVNTAPWQVLVCLLGVNESAARFIATARVAMQGFGSVPEMIQSLPASMRSQVEIGFGGFGSIAVTSPPQLILTVTGVAGARRLQSIQTIGAMAGGNDLVVLWRESE